MSAFQRIWIKATGLGERGQHYHVTHNGATLIESTKNPEFDAARALLARGIVGQVEVWRRGASSPAMRLDIEKCARLTVEDSDCEGLRFVRWRRLSLDNVSGAVSCRAVSARTGINEGVAGTLADKKAAVPEEPPGRLIPHFFWRRSEDARIRAPAQFKAPAMRELRDQASRCRWQADQMFGMLECRGRP